VREDVTNILLGESSGSSTKIFVRKVDEAAEGCRKEASNFIGKNTITSSRVRTFSHEIYRGIRIRGGG